MNNVAEKQTIAFDFECPKCSKKWTEHWEDQYGNRIYKQTLAGRPAKFACEICSEILAKEEKERIRRENLRNNAQKFGFPDDRFLYQYDRNKGNNMLLNKLFLPPLPVNSLWIHGENSVGKTWGVCWAGQKYLQVNPTKTVLYFDCNDLLRRYSEICMEGSEAMRKGLIRRIRSADLLIIDDIGKEGISDCRGEGLCAMLDRGNYSTQKLWLVSNKSLEETLCCFVRPEHANKFGSRVMEYQPTEVQA